MKKIISLSLVLMIFVVTFGQQDKNTERVFNNSNSESNLTLSKDVTRTVLVEQFTTEGCPNCPPVLTYIEGIIEDDPNIIMMCHHAGYGTDFLTIPESVSHLEFYNAGGSTFAPAGMFDRHHNGLNNDNYNGIDPGPVFWDTSPYGGNRITDRASQPAYTTVEISGDINNGEISITVSGEFTDNFTHDLGVSLWITEDHIDEQNQGGASNWVHRYSVRDAISDRLGDEITTSTNNGDTYSKNYNYTLDNSWDINELYLVAMVSYMNNGDVNDREICNAKQLKLIFLMPPMVDFTPEDGAIDIPVDTEIELAFNQPIRLPNNDPITDPAALISFTDNNKANIPFTATINNDNNLITVTPNSDLDISTDYTVSIAAGSIENEYDKILANTYGTTFTTFTPIAPEVEFIPENGSTNVLIDIEIELNFDQPIRLPDNSPITDPTTLITFTDDTKADVAFTATINNDKTIITVTADEYLGSETNYTVSIAANSVENEWDLALENDESTTFTTEELFPPAVTFTPEDGATDVIVDVEVELEFDQAIRLINDDPITDPAALITFVDDEDNPVDFSATINNDNDLITVTPDNDLEFETDYTVSIEGGSVESTYGGIELENDESATFTTENFVNISSLNNNVNIYPNPANNKIFISNANNSTLSITDIYGKIILKHIVSSDSEQINITDLSSGLYILTIELNGYKSEQKLIIN